MGGTRCARLRALATGTVVGLVVGVIPAVTGVGASPAAAACVVGVDAKTVNRYSSTATISATASRASRVVEQYPDRARAVGRARHRFAVDAVATTTLTVTTCALGLEVPVRVSAKRRVRSQQWAFGRASRWGYGGDRLHEAKVKGKRAATRQARARATRQGRDLARSAAHGSALVKAVVGGLLPSNAAYTDAVEQAWLTLANDVRINRGLRPARARRVFEPLAADWARTVHSTYMDRWSSGTIHDAGFMRDLSVSGCSGSFTGGEVIAQMWRYDDPWQTAILIRNSWLKSPSHRAVLLDRRFTLAGAGGHTVGSWVTLVGRYRNGSCASWVR